MTTTYQVQDLGNNESRIRGYYELNGMYCAMTYAQSKWFKTERGAIQWLARRGINADGSRAD